VRPGWRDPEFGHRLPLLRSSDRPAVVVIGTSRTQNAIAPAAMALTDEPGSPRVFNFGQSAATPLAELLALHRLLDAGVRPAAVVVELFPPALGVCDPAGSEFLDRAARLSASDLEHLAPHVADVDELRRRWLVARAFPWREQRQSLLSHWAPRWQPWQRRINFQWESLDGDGFQPVDDVSPERRETLTAHARKQYAAAFPGFRPAEVSVRPVRELVALCRREGIPVAFLVPPVSPEFRAAFGPGVLEESESYLHALAAELGVAVFDAPRHMPGADFMDGHHALTRGAERYSRWLAETHLKPWLSRCRGDP
jgi:hypothetical protein